MAARLSLFGAGLLALFIALYGIATAVLQSNAHWYSYFAAGSYLFFALLNGLVHGRTTLRIAPGANLRPLLRLYGVFFLAGAAIDLLYGRHIGGTWVHPGFSPVDYVVHVLVLGFPFAFLSVLETYFLLDFCILELLPKRKVAAERRKARSLLLLTLGAFSIILPLTLPLSWFPTLVHELLFFCMLGSLCFLDAINSLAGRFSVIDRLLAKDWHLLLSVFLTASLAGLAHEIPNTHAKEWIHQNIPFTSFELFGVNILVLTAGWLFLTLLPLTLFHFVFSQPDEVAPRALINEATPTPLLERLPLAANIHYTLTWLLAGFLLASGHFVVVSFLGLPEPQPLVLLLTAIIFSWICIEIVWANRALRSLLPLIRHLTLESAQPQVTSWYRAHISLAFDTKKLLAMGVLGFFVGLVVPVTSRLPFWHNAPVVVTYDLFLCIVVGSVGMMSQWCFYGIATAIRGLASFPIRPGFFRHPLDSLQAISSVLMKIWLGGIGLIILVELIFFSLGLGESLLLQVFVGAATLGAIFWFFLVHTRLHALMVSEKRKRLSEINGQIEDSLELLSGGYKSSVSQRLRFLSEIHQTLRRLPEWPFDTAMLLRFVTASVSPLATLVLQRVLGD